MTRTYKRKRRKKKYNKSRKFKKVKCSPKKKKDILEYTCYTKDSLHKLKQIWNARHPDVHITTNDPEEIWNSLKKYMEKTCHTESCWLRHQCIKNDVDSSLWDDMFAPKYPKEWKINPYKWLTSVDIQKVMRQWEQSYSCFEFIGPSPIDYDKHLLFDECVWEELCKFSLLDMKKRGKTKIGIIFNLDPHYKRGSHWVALFINLKKKEIYFFDSYGEKIPKNIYKFVEIVKKQALSRGENYMFYQGKKRHQYSETECGMYTLYFIIQLLQDRPFSYFENNKIPDKYMKKLRKIYFNSLNI